MVERRVKLLVGAREQVQVLNLLNLHHGRRVGMAGIGRNGRDGIRCRELMVVQADRVGVYVGVVVAVKGRFVLLDHIIHVMLFLGRLFNHLIFLLVD